jgi:hypothetical protein
MWCRDSHARAAGHIGISFPRRMTASLDGNRLALQRKADRRRPRPQIGALPRSGGRFLAEPCSTAHKGRSPGTRNAPGSRTGRSGRKYFATWAPAGRAMWSGRARKSSSKALWRELSAYPGQASIQGSSTPVHRGFASMSTSLRLPQTRKPSPRAEAWPEAACLWSKRGASCGKRSRIWRGYAARTSCLRRAQSPRRVGAAVPVRHVNAIHDPSGRGHDASGACRPRRVSGAVYL